MIAEVEALNDVNGAKRTASIKPNLDEIPQNFLQKQIHTYIEIAKIDPKHHFTRAKKIALKLNEPAAIKSITRYCNN
ncbi:MAG: hypothetical protein H0T62_04245 [Parachlamydiaceae bacterium]|nr:hypothetical protein [Parachlamydiaceae bacterium]